MALTMDPPPSLLQSDLLTIKHASDPQTLFPSHAYGRGGVGHFLCTGHSRAGIHRLPQAASAAGSLSLTARSGRLSSRSGGADTGGFSLVDPNDPLSVGATRAWEAGSAVHSSNFVSACRSVRPTDVPPGSKWAAVSFFENDPREVGRHLQILDILQRQADNAKAAERQAEQARHSAWAEQQRETFRRQRLEQAVKYTRAGMRPRSAYAELGALAAAEATHAAADAAARREGFDASQDGSYSGTADFGRRPDPTYGFYTAAAIQQTLGSRVQRSQSLPYRPGGKPRPATALAATGVGSSNAFAATLQATAAFPPRAAIPLPKKTYVHVFDRMAAEANETPAAKAAAVAAQQAQAEEERQTAQRAAEMQELDSFEARMRSLQRARSRAAQRTDRRISDYDDH
ncbi:hypothetical protein HYH03_011512 [Edaphochlamys debaryana]|uniref:Uncharacterized protein n=1 Tax=Edaphochlamys debaryana TaxID=47281 RepID=A0A836BVH5_9CHLO|nr:hypothetical protein HYH03_011512 [Edaphochlamys debaryana]|eukprot:KAG2490047.1 hypothetical protein HYH03_011512 [Edaphochlamys debaryana]